MHANRLDDEARAAHRNDGAGWSGRQVKRSEGDVKEYESQ